MCSSVSRSEGHSAAKRSAYQACGRAVDHEGRAFDYSRKAAEHAASMMLIPDGAPEWTRGSGEVWRRAAAIEKRVDAQEARIVDMSMPRQIPQELWEPCIRQVYDPFRTRGMVLQIDVHDIPASDGGRNVNIHGIATLRRIDGNGFAKKKERAWNDWFRERDGRAIREMIAGRLTDFCRTHGIDYVADARSNAERGRPAPELDLPRWNFEAAKRSGVESEALADLQAHRRRRREWEAAEDERAAASAEGAAIERIFRRPRICPAQPDQRSVARRDRRAGVLRAWHGGTWVDATVTQHIGNARFDERRACLWLDLSDGTTLVDTGDAIHLRAGRITWIAAVETAAAAQRHGWTSVDVFGDQAYRDEVTVACALRGIEVANHTLSPDAKLRLEAMRVAERQSQAHPGRSSLDAFHRLRAQRKAAMANVAPEQSHGDESDAAPAYRPRPSRHRRDRSNRK